MCAESEGAAPYGVVNSQRRKSLKGETGAACSKAHHRGYGNSMIPDTIPISLFFLVLVCEWQLPAVCCFFPGVFLLGYEIASAKARSFILYQHKKPIKWLPYWLQKGCWSIENVIRFLVPLLLGSIIFLLITLYKNN